VEKHTKTDQPSTNWHLSLKCKGGVILATLQGIIDYLNRKYPSHGESDANIVKDLQDLHVDIFMQLRRLINNFSIYQVSSVNNQLIYNLPTGIRMEDIFDVLVSTDTAGTIFEKYEYRGYQEDLIFGRYYGRASGETFYVMKDTAPLRADNLKIHLYYYPRPTPLDSSDLTQVPDLDEDYHDLLKFGIVQAIASQGHNPDIDIANYYQQKYDEKFANVKKHIDERLYFSNLNNAQQKEWW
jgi:hypothetical protein